MRPWVQFTDPVTVGTMRPITKLADCGPSRRPVNLTLFLLCLPRLVPDIPELARCRWLVLAEVVETAEHVEDILPVCVAY